MENTLSIWINHIQLSEKLKQLFTATENMIESLENSALKYRCTIKTEYSILHVQIWRNKDYLFLKLTFLVQLTSYLNLNYMLTVVEKQLSH